MSVILSDKPSLGIHLTVLLRPGKRCQTVVSAYCCG